ncbi:hypothetical protein F5I97DRAFT_107759 [Phlebopus sp. FC_14]|nr:hypothetical protein F5I97DRAFT_107759 [Phlebopus sp. FC_14]
MLPVTDLHFAFCGIATVAATIGYAYSRKATPTTSPSTNPTKADVEAGLLPLPEERSLKKRKLDDSDDVESDQDDLSRPMKRSRTPPADSDSHDGDGDEWEVIVAPPAYEEAVTPPPQQFEPVQRSNITSTQTAEIVPGQRDATTPDREPTPPVIIDVREAVEQQTVEQKQQEREADSHIPTSQHTPTPTPLSQSNNVRSTAPATTSPPQKITPPPPRRANPFSTFTSSSSPFASYSSHGRASFGLAADAVTATPAWRRAKERSFDAALAETSSGDALAPAPNDVSAFHKAGSSSSVTSSSSSPKTMSHAIEPATQTKAQTSSQAQTHAFAEPSKQPSRLTGEEDETITSELKGVKLFIKRGKKEFTDGMYGYVKVLSHSPVISRPVVADDDGCDTDSRASVTGLDTNTNKNETPRSRILFRRDPLGQVSMNVALQPTVRCHFDAAENILRIILKERVGGASSDASRNASKPQKGSDDGDGEGKGETDVVVYALKPGRSPKAEFQTFATSLCAGQELQKDVEAGTACGEA